MAGTPPLLICAQCCSTDIEGPEHPEDTDVLRCRQCGYQVTYGVMREQVRMALEDALRQIHEQVAGKVPRLFR